MPSFVAASRSTLSTPTPALATTRSFLPAESRDEVTLVSERTMSASYSPMMFSRSSGLKPFFSSTSKDSCRSFRPSGLTFSGIKTFDRGLAPFPTAIVWVTTRRILEKWEPVEVVCNRQEEQFQGEGYLMYVSNDSPIALVGLKSNFAHAAIFSPVTMQQARALQNTLPSPHICVPHRKIRYFRGCLRRAVVINIEDLFCQKGLFSSDSVLLMLGS